MWLSTANSANNGHVGLTITSCGAKDASASLPRGTFGTRTHYEKKANWQPILRIHPHHEVLKV